MHQSAAPKVRLTPLIPAADMNYPASRLDPVLVTASVLIATLSASVMLDFATRSRGVDRRTAQALLGLASLAMGTSIWSMHFVGMLAYSLPISLGYTQSMTALFWLTSVLACFVALHIATGEPSLPQLVGGALALLASGLPNRLAIAAQLQRIAAAAEAPPPRVAALFIEPGAAPLAWARSHKPQGAVDFAPSTRDEALAA